MPATKKTPTEPTKRKRRLKFRTDLIPWLSKRKDVVVDEDDDDPLKWDKTEAEAKERNRWPAVIAISAILGVAGGLIYTYTRPPADEPVAEKQAQPDIFKPDLQAKARECVEGFHAAETVSEKLKFVAWPEKVESRMHDFYSRYPDESAALTDFQYPSATPRFGTDNEYFVAAAVQIEENLRVFCVMLNEGGTLKLDWESFVAYSPVSLEEFISKPPQDAVQMRLKATRSTYFNYEFSDPEKFQAYDLMSAQSDSIRLHAYTEIGSEAHKRMEQAFAGRSVSEIPLRLLLAPPSVAGRPACKIERLIKPHWSGE